MDRVFRNTDWSVSAQSASHVGDGLPRPTPEGLFVGREHELAQLQAGLDDALSGRGRLFLVGGEPGIGKSRLADELASRAKDQGARVLWGRCWEAGGAPAYWPWVQAIRTYLRGQDPAELPVQLGSGAADVAQIIPEVHDLFPELRPRPSSDPEGARFRLFDSTTAFLRSAARIQPLVLVLDDLHAADAPSLLLLRFVAGELADAHILIIGAYRDEGMELPDQLASTLTEVGRQQTTSYIRMVGLDETEVTRFIESTVGRSTPRGLIAAVHRKSEGNPLFVGELIRLLAAEGELEAAAEATAARISIPRRIREVIDRRLGSLSDRCRGVLTVASVLGREFDLDALAHVADGTAEELLDVMGEAEAARVVTEVPGAIGRLRFSHALVRDALYEDLSPARRARLHRQIGEALEDLYAEDPGPHLAELAFHFCEAVPAGDVDKAVRYTWRAGDRASSLLAYEEGVRLFGLALRVLETKGPVDGEPGCRLLLALGEAEAREGDLAAAKEAFLRATGLARKLGLPRLLADGALGYGGRFVWARTGSDRRLVPLLEEALGWLPMGDDPVRVRLMARLAGALRDQRTPDQQDGLSREAVEMARRIDDPGTLAYALEGRFAATWWPDNADERLAVATQIVELARAANDGERLAQGRDWQTITLMELGDIPGMDAKVEALGMLADELRQPAQWWLVRTVLAMRALFDGRFQEAERLITEAMGIGERAQRWDAVFAYRIQMYFLRWEQGRLDEMEAPLKRSVAEYPTRDVFRCLLAHLYCELGRTVETRRAFEEVAVDDFTTLRRDNDWLLEMSLLADVADHLGDIGRAEVLYDLLSPYTGRHVPTGGEVGTGSISRSVGILASVLRRWDEAARRFEEGLELNARMGARPWMPHTQYDYARMLLRRDGVGDRERAADLIGAAAAACEQLGMSALGLKVAGLRGESQPGVLATIGRPSARPARERDVFRREGEYWSIRFGRDAFRLKDSKGLGYLAHLLTSPGREFLALDLATAERGPGPGGGAKAGRDLSGSGARTSSGRSEEILDPRAKHAYRRRLEELQAELDEAERWRDPERAVRAREEMEVIAHELAAAVGLLGRDRRAPSDAERARVNVTKAIKAALARIGEHSPALGRHLASTIRTGTFCSYIPDPRVATGWQL